jgi:hypothetical protein
MNYREYTCIKDHNSDTYKVYNGIMYLSEAQTFEDYKIIKVPIVQVSGLESLYYATMYDRHFIQEKLKTNFIKFV